MGDVLRAVVLAVSAAATIWAAVPYLVDIRAGRTRPRLSSWVIWTAAMAIGAAAAASKGQLVPAAYIGLCAAEAAAIVALGWARRGDGAAVDGARASAFDWLDGVCVAGAAAGLVLLVAVRAPGPAAVVSCATDLLAYVPTIRHAWRAPSEETWQTYALYGAGSALLLLVTDWGVWAGLAYPLYLAVFDSGAAALIVARRRRLAAAAPIRQEALR
jgi:hypothetical protein